MTEAHKHNGPTFKLVVIRQKDRVVGKDIELALTTRVGEDSVLRLSDSGFLVHTQLEPMEIRDWLKSHFSMEEQLLVVEFERWSGFGESEAWKWLLWRGH
ncbi:MAG: hypothetical protein EXR50_00705 [Dehalococcoidia bacterium]|nr:hypothetical protein [Dehalococcoidia bacterium]